MMEPRHLSELDERGYTVVKKVVSPALTAKARDLMDRIIGAPPPAQGLGLETCPPTARPRAGSPARGPCRETTGR